MTSRRLLVSIVALAFGVAARAADLPVSDPRVRMEYPQLRLVPDSELGRFCRSSAHVYACTDFPQETLRAGCTETRAGWNIEATAHLSPVTYLSKPRWMQHEAVHLNHVARMLTQYLDGLAEVEFESWAACMSAAAAAEQGFRVRMNGFRMISNLTYR